MAKQYTFTKKEVGQRPRSKRLRECNVEFPSAHVQAQGTLDLSGKVDVGFFSMLFEAQDSEGNAISVNSPIGKINRLRVKCNLFSDFGVSALGYSPGGSSDGGDVLTSPLAEINAAGLGIPSSAGLGIVWNGSQWTYGQVGGTDINAVWASLASEDNTKQIDISHLTNALAGYATQSWVSSQNKFGIIGSDYVEITLNGTTKNVLAAHQSLADYVKNIQLGTNGTVYSPTSGKITLPAYPTTLPASDVSAWAKAANKPSYGFSEITGSVAASQLPTMYWADIAITNQSNNNTSPQFGNLRLRPGNANYGSYLRFGDSNYCYLYEDTDDHLLIYASKGVKITTGTSYRLMWGDNTVATLADIDGMATKTWVTDNMMKKARLDTTANIDTLYDAGSYRFGATAEGTWPVTSNYGQVLVVRGADDTVAQMFFPYVESKAYLRTGNPINQNGSWRAWKELATTDGNIATATRLASNDTKTLFGNTYWNSGQPQNVGTSWANASSLNYVNELYMKGGLLGVKYLELNNNQNDYATDIGGYIDFHYSGSSSDYTSRIIEDQNGRLNFNGTAFIYKSNKPGSASDFPGGALNETTDWGGYSFRNVFTNNSLFENTLFLRTDLFMKTNTGIRIKNYAGANVMALSLESNSSNNNNIVVGAGAHTIAGVSTYIRGNTVNFQTANGAGSTLVGHFSNGGDFYIDVAGKSLMMNDGTTTRNMVGINIPATHFHLCYGAVGADWQTRIYGGGGDNKGIAFFHGTALAASVEGGDHSLVAYYHIKLTTNNQSLYTRNTSNTPVDTVRLTPNNILYLGYGCSTNNHESRIYGGATAGIGFFCGSTEVARVHKDAARQGIRIGDGLLSWDSTNNAFKVSKIDSGGNEVAANLYALGGVSALGFTAPQSSIDAFHIDYLTSTSVTAQTMHASMFYLNSSIYLYLDGSSLKITNGTTTKTITTL